MFNCAVKNLGGIEVAPDQVAKRLRLLGQKPRPELAVFMRAGAANDLRSGSVVETFQPPAMHFEPPTHFKRPGQTLAFGRDQSVSGKGRQIIHGLLQNCPGKQLVATALGAFAARPHGRLAVEARAGESFQFVDHLSSWIMVLTDQAQRSASAHNMSRAIKD